VQLGPRKPAFFNGTHPAWLSVSKKEPEALTLANAMHTKIFFLFFLAMFGAYAEFEAGKVVRALRNQQEEMRRESEVEKRDSAFKVKAIDRSVFKVNPSNGHRDHTFVEGNMRLKKDEFNKIKSSIILSAVSESDRFIQLEKNPPAISNHAQLVTFLDNHLAPVFPTIA
jgi:hypothetical protein